MTEGIVHNKDRFLDKISNNLGRERKEQLVLPKWQHRPQLEVFKDAAPNELLTAFRNNSLEKTTYVVDTETAKLAETLQKVTEKYGGGPVVTTKDPRFSEYGIDSLLTGEGVHVWDAALGKENIEIAKKANIGIFFSDISLAESGTVVQFNDKDIARSISLLPIVYVAIVPKSTIVPRMTQASQAVHKLVQDGKEIPTCINFISGPSNSADIEMDIVIGVHGPVEAVHIIVSDR